MTPFRQFSIFFYDLRGNVWGYMHAPNVRNRATCAARRPVNREKRSAILNRRQHTEFIRYSLAFDTCASASKRRRDWHMARLSRPTRGLTIGQKPAWVDTNIFIIVAIVMTKLTSTMTHEIYCNIYIDYDNKKLCMYVYKYIMWRQAVSEQWGQGGVLSQAFTPLSKQAYIAQYAIIIIFQYCHV